MDTVKIENLAFSDLWSLIYGSYQSTDMNFKSQTVKYFNELINRFPQNVNTTELYLRLAMEYEKNSQWEQALKTCALFQ